MIGCVLRNSYRVDISIACKSSAYILPRTPLYFSDQLIPTGTCYTSI